MAAGILAKQKNLSYVILEKGSNPMQGIIDTYPKGKKVYPTIPKRYTQPFPVDEVRPPDERVPVETYIDQARGLVKSLDLKIRFNEEFKTIEGNHPDYMVKTDKGSYLTSHIILAFGSNIPNDLGIYGGSKNRGQEY